MIIFGEKKNAEALCTLSFDVGSAGLAWNNLPHLKHTLINLPPT